MAWAEVLFPEAIGFHRIHEARAARPRNVGAAHGGRRPGELIRTSEPPAGTLASPAMFRTATCWLCLLYTWHLAAARRRQGQEPLLKQNLMKMAGPPSDSSSPVTLRSR
jgi:hypothetical protein